MKFTATIVLTAILSTIISCICCIAVFVYMRKKERKLPSLFKQTAKYIDPIKNAYDLREFVRNLPANILEGLAHENMHESASQMAYAIICFAGQYSRYSLRQLAKIYERSCFYSGDAHSARIVRLEIHEYVRRNKEIWKEFIPELRMSNGEMSFLKGLSLEKSDQELVILITSTRNFKNARVWELEAFIECLKKIKGDESRILLAEIRAHLKVQKKNDRAWETAKEKEEKEKQKILNPA